MGANDQDLHKHPREKEKRVLIGSPFLVWPKTPPKEIWARCSNEPFGKIASASGHGETRDSERFGRKGLQTFIMVFSIGLRPTPFTLERRLMNASILPHAFTRKKGAFPPFRQPYSFVHFLEYGCLLRG